METNHTPIPNLSHLITVPGIKRMRKAIVNSNGEINFSVEQLPEPAYNEIRIRLKGFSMERKTQSVNNFNEIKIGFNDAYGIVDKTGDCINDFLPGDHVAILKEMNFSEFIIVEENDILKIPDDLKNTPFYINTISNLMNVFGDGVFHNKQTATLIGDGFEMLVLIALAKKQGTIVYAAAESDETIDEFLISEADVVIKLDYKQGVIHELYELTHNKPVNTVILFDDTHAKMEIASQITNESSKIYVLSTTGRSIPISNREVIYTENLHTGMNNEREKIINAVGLLKTIKFSPTSIDSLSRFGQLNPYTKNISKILNTQKKIYLTL